MKLTIIPVNGYVKVEEVGYDNLVLPSIPSNVNALQWDGNVGEIEYSDAPNEPITSLPEWATDCIAVYNTQHTEWTTEEEERIARESSDEYKAEVIRNERDWKLLQTDWWELPSHGGMTTEESTYRQALRDITSQATFPESVEWPVKP